MEVTKQQILEFFKDPENLFFLWDRQDSFPTLVNIRLVEHMAIVFTMEGKINFNSALQERAGDPEHLVIANNVLCGSIMNSSDDYRCEGIIISKQFWDRMIIQCHPCTSIAMVNPILEIRPDQKSMLLDFLHTLIDLRRKGKRDDEPVMKHLVNGMLMEISKIYEEQVQNETMRSGQRLVDEFTRLVYDHYKEHRDVEFYADRMKVSKRYLSAAVKNQSGKSAFKCIQMHVIMQACFMLRQSDRSVKEIALDLHFDDTSHFCKYFRKGTGMSPEEYRKNDLQLL